MSTLHKFCSALIIIICFLAAPLSAQTYKQPKKPMKYWSAQEMEVFLENQRQINLTKPTGPTDRRFGIMDGNAIRTLFYNYGSIGRPNTEPSIEWPKESGNGYAYEFGPLIGAEIVEGSNTLHIFSDALIDNGDTSPSGKVYGWQPLPQYLNTNSTTPAMSNDPASWPQTQDASNPFYNVNNTGPDDTFLWPGLDGQGKLSADMEAYWVMDDRDNDEFPYYPFVNDSLRRGLGLELTCRLLQFSASLAQDMIFYIVEVKNVSDKRLDNVVVSMFGDPHIGGAPDFADDYAGFDSTLNMVYAWDAENSTNSYGIPWADVGWLGFKFLESPKDSLGNELGLTSMSAPLYASYYGDPKNDEIIWQQLVPGEFADILQNRDNVFLFGSGYFSIDPDSSQQFSIAILLGRGLDDLNSNAQIAQDIYNAGYSFAKAPPPPQLAVVPDDGKVSLYWDKSAESFYDDYLNIYDFEGYKIYRSTDKINWGDPITDINGAVMSYKPMAQYDLKNFISGFFKYELLGTNFYLGDDTGLKHTFVDENIINGITYYYLVTSYDAGYDYGTRGIQPVESRIQLGVNMQPAVPRARVPGYIDATADEINHTDGYATGNIEAVILDPTLIEDTQYEIIFTDTSSLGKTLFIYTIDPQGDTVWAVENNTNFAGEPIIFNGLITYVTDETKIDLVDTLGTSPDSIKGWAPGSMSTLRPVVTLFTPGILLPRDIEFRFFDTIVDTSVVFNIKPVKFEVWNKTDNEQMDFVYLETNNNDTVDVGDKIIPVVYENSVAKFTWQVEFFEPSDSTISIVNPEDGDVFRILVSKPFETIDKYTINTAAASVNKTQAKEVFLDKVAVVPNPYVVSSIFETSPASIFSQGRGERRVDFIHLPPKCTIRIFTTNGELIRVIDHSTDMFDDRESWDLLTSEGLDIAYGIYIFHIDAGEYGEKIGKFAIIK